MKKINLSVTIIILVVAILILVGSLLYYEIRPLQCKTRGGSKKDDVGMGAHMATSFTLHCNGTVIGTTHLWSERKFFGLFANDFFGCLRLHLDNDNASIWISKIHRFNSDRKGLNNLWVDKVPKKSVSLVNNFDLEHAHC